MKFIIEISPACARDLKRYKKKHYDMNILFNVIELMQNGEQDILVQKYRDHALTGNWSGYRELHLLSDWLLIYRIDHQKLIIALVRSGSHDDLF